MSLYSMLEDINALEALNADTDDRSYEDKADLWADALKGAYLLA